MPTRKYNPSATRSIYQSHGAALAHPMMNVGGPSSTAMAGQTAGGPAQTSGRRTRRQGSVTGAMVYGPMVIGKTLVHGNYAGLPQMSDLLLGSAANVMVTGAVFNMAMTKSYMDPMGFAASGVLQMLFGAFVMGGSPQAVAPQT